MTVWQAIVLGAMQGLTEFLPVSSSGHLVIVQDLLGLVFAGLTFEIVVHGGTLVAVFVVFGPKAVALIRGTWCWLGQGRRATPHDVESARVLLLLGLATIPGALVGLTLRHWVENLFSLPIYSAWGLLLTGGLLFSARDLGYSGQTMRGMTLWTALCIGVLQALAIAPGVSRSGSTITAGLWLGLSRKAAAEFSFLLSIPAIIGALLMDLLALGARPAAIGADALVAGAVTAALFGYIAIRLLLRFLHVGRYHQFGYYVWTVGFLVLLSQVG